MIGRNAKAQAKEYVVLFVSRASNSYTVAVEGYPVIVRAMPPTVVMASSNSNAEPTLLVQRTLFSGDDTTEDRGNPIQANLSIEYEQRVGLPNRLRFGIKFLVIP